jgi:hypothetical protein
MYYQHRDPLKLQDQNNELRETLLKLQKVAWSVNIEWIGSTWLIWNQWKKQGCMSPHQWDFCPQEYVICQKFEDVWNSLAAFAQSISKIFAMSDKDEKGKPNQIQGHAHPQE